MLLEDENKEPNILEGELLLSGQNERIFANITALADYIKTFAIENGRFGVGNMDGQKCYVLQYQSKNR